MDERLKFIARLLDGEKMAELCRESGVSRKTGYKILSRYNSCGLQGLTDRSRRPYRQANQLPVQIETLIVRLKQDKPTWGAPKIRERLARLYPDVHTPAISTVHAVLDRHGLVKRRSRRRNRAKGHVVGMDLGGMVPRGGTALAAQGIDDTSFLELWSPTLPTHLPRKP